MKLTIVERLKRIAQGKHLDLADIVCADALVEMKEKKVPEREIRAVIDGLLKRGKWPIYRTQDDNGLEREEYFEFARDVLWGMGFETTN